MINQEEFNDWLQHPVTQEVRRVLAGKRADLRNEWEMSNPAEYAKDTFVLGNVANVGFCRGLAFAESLDYEGYMSEVDPDGESKRAETPGSGRAD